MFLQKRVINGITYTYLDHSFRIGNEVKKVSLILDKNKQDKTAVRGLQLTSSKLRRLVKYYKEKNKLPPEFSLDITRLKMYLE